MSVFWASEEFFAALLPVATRGIAACLAQTAAQGCYIHLDTRWKLLGGVLKPKKARGGFESSRLTSSLALTDKMI